MKNRKTFKQQKPKRFEGHLVYECPECECDNYITLSEAMTEDFVIVCPECNSVLRPTLVVKMKVYYDEPAASNKKHPPVPERQAPVFTSPEPTPSLEDITNDNNIIPDHEYMQESKFAVAEPLEKTFEINVLTDEQMSAITEAVKVLKKYGYTPAAASKLASDCMRENCADLTIDKKKLVELCLRKEGAKINE